VHVLPHRNRAHGAHRKHGLEIVTFIANNGAEFCGVISICQFVNMVFYSRNSKIEFVRKSNYTHTHDRKDLLYSATFLHEMWIFSKIDFRKNQKYEGKMDYVRYGDIISAESQSLTVNCRSDPPIEENWVKVEGVLIDYGEKWLKGRLKMPRGEPEYFHVYLIHDEVGHDGWGAITVYRNVVVTGRNEMNFVTAAVNPIAW
jgi:hypothetical protein